jgi:hypothetical protein
MPPTMQVGGGVLKNVMFLLSSVLMLRPLLATLNTDASTT